MTNPGSIFGVVNDFANNTRDAARNSLNFINSAVSGGFRNPVWLCRYPIGDVTYPEFYNYQTFPFGNTAGASAGTAHTHDLFSADSATSVAVWSIPQNGSRGGYVGVSRTVVYDTVGTIIKKDAGSIDNVYLEIFAENEAGELNRLWVSSDISSSLTTSAAFMSLTIDPPLIGQAGERMMVRVRNSSTVANVVRVFGPRQTAGSVDASAYTTTSTDTDQTFYSATDAATFKAASSVLPWFVIAADNLSVTDQSFTDDFNRSDIGALWLLGSDTSDYLTIVANRAAMSGSSDSQQAGLCIYPTSYDDSRVEGDIHDTFYADGSYIGLLLHCSRDFGQFVFLAVNDTAAEIGTSLGGTTTSREDIAREGNDGHWSLTYDSSTNTYTALLNDEDVGLSWEDTGNVVSHSRDYRYGGLNIQRISGAVGGTLDNWTLRDFMS